MLKLAPLSKNFRETGALNESVPFFGFLDDETVLTKGGDLLNLLRIEGRDPEGLDPAQLDHLTKRLEASFRLFGPEFRIYQILFKRNRPEIPSASYASPVVNTAIEDRILFFAEKAPRLYTVEIVYVVMYEGFRHRADVASALAKLPRAPLAALKELHGLVSTKRQITLVRSALERAERPLRRAVDSFLVQLSDFVDARKLRKDECFRVLRRLVNFDPATADAVPLKYDTHLDYFVCDSPIECHPDHLLVDGLHTRVLTVKDLPAQTFSNFAAPLLAIPANFHIVSEWHPLDTLRAKEHIQRHRRHFHNTKLSFLSQMSSGDTTGGDVLVDDSKAAMVHSLGQLAQRLELDGDTLGDFSSTCVVYDDDPEVVEKAAAELEKIYSLHDGSVFEETYNQVNAFFATLPGNVHHNLRRSLVLNTNYADASFLFSLDTGAVRNDHLDAEYLAVLETTHDTPYFLNLHHADIAHTLMLGMTGAGKSFLLNFLLTNAQKYDPYTFLFDLGGSYRGLTELLGGSYLRLGIDSQDVTTNPFALPPTRENHHFLFSFVKVLLDGDAAAALAAGDDKEIYAAIESLQQVDAKIRRLSTLAALLPKRLSERLSKWVQGGQYETLFDHEEDTLSLGRFQCLDFEGMAGYPELLQPLLFYVLHRANAVIYDPGAAGVFKAFVMDEAWRFFQHPTIRAYIVEALKTWRKKNAALILATQSLDELAKSDILHIVNESCPTKLFLANPEMDRAFYRETFHLTDTELELIAGLVPKRQFLLKRPDSAKVLNLEVDPKSYWLYTNHPADNVRRQEAFAKWGFDEGLRRLAEGDGA